MRNQGGGLQWHSSVIFIRIPWLVNHLCTFPLTFDSKPQSQARIRSHNNKLTSCSGIVSCQIRGRGSRATGPLGHPRDYPKTPHSSVVGPLRRPLIVISAPSRPIFTPPPPPRCPGKQNGPDSFVMRGSVRREQASDFQIHCPC